MYENWDKICTNETPKHNIDKTRRSAKVHLDLTCRGHCPSACRGSEFDLLSMVYFLFPCSKLNPANKSLVALIRAQVELRIRTQSSTEGAQNGVSSMKNER